MTLYQKNHKKDFRKYYLIPVKTISIFDKHGNLINKDVVVLTGLERWVEIIKYFIRDYKKNKDV